MNRTTKQNNRKKERFKWAVEEGESEREECRESKRKEERKKKYK